MRVRPQAPPADTSDTAEVLAQANSPALQNPKPALDLPDDIVFAIFAECDADDLPVLTRHGRVNRQWHRVSQDERLYPREAPPADWREGRKPPQRPADVRQAKAAGTSSHLPEPMRKLGQRLLGHTPRPLPTVPAPKRPEPAPTPGQRYQAWLAGMTPQQRKDIAEAYQVTPYFAHDFAKRHRADADVCWALVSRFGDAIRHTRFQHDPAMWRMALSNAGFVMEYATQEQERDLGGALIAVGNHPPAVRFLHASLKDNLEVGLLAVKGDPATVVHLSPRLQAHEQILAMVANTPAVDTDWNSREWRCLRMEWYG